MTKHVTDIDFSEEVLKFGMPVLVDFYADWCSPCKEMGPIIDELANELKGDAKVVKVDVSKSKDLASKYGISMVPTFIIFKNGQMKEQFSGVYSKKQLFSKMKNI